MKSSVRQGEEAEGKATDRSDRVFQKGTFWYFHTRENVQIGPFESHELALKGANDYVGFAMDATPDLLDTLTKE
jgi:hypothetical protein